MAGISQGQDCIPVCGAAEPSFQVAPTGVSGAAAAANRGNIVPQVSQDDTLLGLFKPHSGHRTPDGLSSVGGFIGFEGSLISGEFRTKIRALCAYTARRMTFIMLHRESWSW